MEQFVPKMNEAYIDRSGNVIGLSVPIWYEDPDLSIGRFIAYRKDGHTYAAFFDFTEGGIYRVVYVAEYDIQLLMSLPEEAYATAHWVYDAMFMHTPDDFEYGPHAILDLDDEGMAKTMFVLMAGNDQFRHSSKRAMRAKNEAEFEHILDQLGLDLLVMETIKKTGRKTWTIYSEKGRRLGKAHSLSAAKRRLKQIEYFKHINESSVWTEDEIVQIAGDAGIDLSQYDMDEILLGMPIELEHGTKSQPDANVTDDDPLMTLKIVLAHLKEIDKYYSEMLIPGEAAHGVHESMPVPFFEDFTNDDFQMTDWYIGNSIEPDSRRGAAVRSYDSGSQETELTEVDIEKLSPYMDHLRTAYDIFYDITEPHKSGEQVIFGFSGPVIQNGPYAGSPSWWKFGTVGEGFFLINDITGQVYEVDSLAVFDELLDGIISELYGEEGTNDD